MSWVPAQRRSVCRIPATAGRARNEAERWRRQVWRVLRHPGEARTGEVAYGALFALELFALYKVGEFVGRGFTIFGYWP